MRLELSDEGKRIRVIPDREGDAGLLQRVSGCIKDGDTVTFQRVKAGNLFELVGGAADANKQTRVVRPKETRKK